LVIGGYAVVFHGHVRLTADIDLFIRSSAGNARKILAAFEDLHLAHPDLTLEGIVKPGSVFKFGRAPHQVELLNDVKGITWDEAWRGAVSEQLFGQKVRYLDFETLIKSKKAAGRLQDLADVEALERIRRDAWLQ